MSEVRTDSDGTDLVIVFAGGSAPASDRYLQLIATAPRVAVIVADSGADQAIALGVHVDIAVGDFDSVSEEACVRMRAAGTDIRTFRADKDFSDLELALEAAVELAPRRIHVLGLGGGRPDHQAVNLAVLTDPALRSFSLTGDVDDCLVSVLRGDRTLTGPIGSLVTLLPVGGPAVVRTAGLEFPLHDETLEATSARGLSNLMTDGSASVSVQSGVVLAFQPGRARVEGGHHG